MFFTYIYYALVSLGHYNNSYCITILYTVDILRSNILSTSVAHFAYYFSILYFRLRLCIGLYRHFARCTNVLSNLCVTEGNMKSIFPDGIFVNYVSKLVFLRLLVINFINHVSYINTHGVFSLFRIHSLQMLSCSLYLLMHLILYTLTCSIPYTHTYCNYNSLCTM